MASIAVGVTSSTPLWNLVAALLRCAQRPCHLRVQPYFILHKRDQVQAFDESMVMEQLKPFTTEQQFLECLAVSDELFPSKIPDSHNGLSFDGFCSLANDIAKSIKATHFPNDDLLVFKDTEYNTPKGHVTGTQCRPDITAAFEMDWVTAKNKGKCTDWALIRLAGEKASTGKSYETQIKNAATYLHYLLLARPDFRVAQGLLTTKKAVIFYVGIGGVGIQQLEVDWGNKNLYKFIYAFIYRLYKPSHFADPSYTRTSFNKETSGATYTLTFKKEEFLNFRPIHARNPFATRTHVLSNPSLTRRGDRSPTVLKEQLCRTGRRFDEWTILTKIHRPKNVPGVVEAVESEIIDAPLSPERKKHRLWLRQTGSPFTSIPTAKKVLETLFDLLEVLRFLRFEREILHRDISVGNVMYIENPESAPEDEVEQLNFAKYLLKESKVRHETSLLLVDFNLGEDMGDKMDENRMERIGTPIFISRAVEQGNPVPFDEIFRVPEVPKSPKCYAETHSDRIGAFPEESKIIVDSDDLKNQSQDDGWRHELDHDVESVFWLLLYWAMVAQPEGPPVGHISSDVWTSMLGNFKARDRLVFSLKSGDPPENLTHSVYEPLWPLISKLAAILVVDRHWLPKSNIRKRPEYICEAFQRLILHFIVENRHKEFMSCRVNDSLRQVQGVAKSEALSTTPSQRMDRLERSKKATKRRRVSGAEDEDEDEPSWMIQ